MQPTFKSSLHIAQQFNGAAQHYDNAAALSREVGNQLVERLNYIRLQPQLIVDVGSGTGHTARLLEKHYRNTRVLTLDFAHRMLTVAKHKAPWFTRQRFICANAAQLPLADHSVDLIFSNLMLHWCSNVPAIFADWRRVLKPGGLLLFSTFGPDTLQELRRCFAAVDNFSHILPFVDMHNIGDELLRAKFADPVMDREDIIATYPTVQSLLLELKMIGSHNPQETRRPGLTGKAALAKLVASYEHYRSSQYNHLLPATYEIIYGHAFAPPTTSTSEAQTTATEVRIPISNIRTRIDSKIP